MIKKDYSGLFDEESKMYLKKRFNLREIELFDYAPYKCDIDGLISAACIFAPDFVQVNDYVFVENFILEDAITDEFISNLEERFNHNKKSIEMYVNSWSLGDFFINSKQDYMNDEIVIKKFGECLVYFWKNRLEKMFPMKKFSVEICENLYGEYGTCVTMYEKRDE